MALWPNTRTDIIGFQPCVFSGYLAWQSVSQPVERNLAFFANEVIQPTASIPEGAFGARACILAPLVGGGMASGNETPEATMAATGSALAGGPMAGAASLQATADGMSLSLVVGLGGAGSFTLSAEGISLALTLGLNGTVTWSVEATDANLGMIVPIAGGGSFALTPSADLKGLLSLVGTVTPYTELSPQSLAAAVWNATAATSNEPGTMGEKLNDAGSASNPWTEVIESGYTAAEILRLLASVAAAKSSGGGTAAITFRDLGDTKNRIAATIDETGNRTALVLDAS